MTEYVTMEQVAQMLQMQRPASRSLASEIGAMVRDVVGQAGVDGHISLGDVLRSLGVTGFYTAVVPIGTTGIGLSLNVFFPDVPIWDFTQLGLGFGAVIGSWLGGKRLADDYRYTPPSDQLPAPPSDGPDIFGLKIAISIGNRTIFRELLPTIKRGVIRKMVQDTAQLYFASGTHDGKKKNFSKRELGKPWGDRLGEAQVVLKECGYIEEIKNRTHLFTTAGRDWLADYY